MYYDVEKVNKDASALLTDYLAAIMPEAKLNSFQFFCNTDKPVQWHVVMLADIRQQQCLVDGSGKCLGQYDEIIPLFSLQKSDRLSDAITDFNFQLEYASPALPDDLLRDFRIRSLRLRYSHYALSNGYRVRLQDAWGVVDCFGKIIVPVKYRCVESFPFCEHYNYRTDRMLDPGDGLIGEAGLYLCRGEILEQNTTDAYDLQGNLIFEQIQDLYPREESLTTPLADTENGDPLLPTQKRVRSIWVSRQALYLPFPDEPLIQHTNPQGKRYTIRELSAPLKEADTLRKNRLCSHEHWVADPHNLQAAQYLQEEPAVMADFLEPMAQVIGKHFGHSPETILESLPIYAEFVLERSPERRIPAHITLNSPLSELDLKVRPYTVLTRSGITTVRELLALPEEDIPKLRRTTPNVSENVILLQRLLKLRFGQ